MRSIYTIFCVMLFNLSAFAVIGPIIYTSSSICSGYSTTLSDTTAGGTWSSSATSIATITSTTGVVIGISAGSATITYTVGTGYVTTTIIVNPAPGPIFACNNIGMGDTLPFSIGMGCGLPPSYSYSLSSFTVASIGIGSGYIIGLSPGTEILTIAGVSGCEAIFNFTVTPTRLITPIAGAVTKCEGLNDTISDATPGGTWTSIYAPLATIGATTEIFTLLDSPALIITYTLPGGSATCNTYAIANRNPVPITGPSSVCVGDTIYLTSDNSPYDCDDTPMGLFTTSNSGIASVPGTTEWTIPVAGVSAGIAVLSFTDLNTGCYLKDTITVGLPTMSPISGSSSICAGSIITLTDTTSGGTWNSADTTKATVNSTGIVTGMSAGIAIISYTKTESCGTASVSQIITINGAPVAGTITGQDSVCVDSMVTLSDVVTGGVWHSSNSTATIASGMVSGLSSGLDTIFYIVTNTCGSDSTEMYVHIVNCDLNVNRVAFSLAPVISLYPNPASDYLNIEWQNLTTGNIDIILTDIIGHEVYRYISKINSRSGNILIKLPLITGGIYYISVRGQDINYYDGVQVIQ